MKKLFLHIGSHKTATTAIQTALFARRDELKQHGLSVFVTPRSRTDKETSCANSWIDCPSADIRKGVGAYIRDLVGLKERLASLPGDVVLSAENFSWLFSKDEIDRLAEHVREIFEEVQIIVYLRRQDRQAISHHQEGAKLLAQAARAYYSGGGRALPSGRDHYDEYLDYHARLRLWGDAFGFDRVTVRLFEPARLKDGDPVVDFFECLGVPVECKMERVNESYGFQRTKLGHLLGQYPRGSLTTMLRELPDAGHKLLPSREDALAFYDRYRASNRELNDLFKLTSTESLFEDDFSFYPECAEDQWDEESS